jgi:outer membrane lipoprotein-sorting protein
MLTLILNLTADEILQEMSKSWENVKDYYSTLYSWTKKDNETELKEYEHKFLKPGYVYLKVIRGGSGEACYDPNTGKAKGRKFGITLTLDPEKDKRIQSIRGDRIYDAGILRAIERTKTYKDIQFNGEKTIDNIKVFEISATIDPNKNYSADREIIYIRKDNYLPYGYIQYKGNVKVKEVYWKNLKLNNGYSVKDVCF